MSITKNDNRLLSIIVPAFNAGCTIGRCIESILSQTYQNFEIIIVDDGSTDNTSSIVQEYVNIDNRVHLLNQNNKGPSCARNQGLSVARGRYLAFVDADDKIEREMYTTLIDCIDEEHAQMVICRWYVHREKNNEVLIPDIGRIGRITPEAIQEEISSDDFIFGGGFLWNRVIDFEYLRKKKDWPIFFDEDIRLYEDKIWILKVLKMMSSIVVLEYTGYHYYVNNTSVSHGLFSTNRCIDVINARKRLVQTTNCKKAFPKQFDEILQNIWLLYRKGDQGYALRLFKENQKEIAKYYSKNKMYNIRHYFVLSIISTILN